MHNTKSTFTNDYHQQEKARAHALFRKNCKMLKKNKDKEDSSKRSEENKRLYQRLKRVQSDYAKVALATSFSKSPSRQKNGQSNSRAQSVNSSFNAANSNRFRKDHSYLSISRKGPFMQKSTSDALF